MCVRELLEAAEERRLNSYAYLSSNASGRARSEQRDPMRMEFQRDRDRITHSKAFRRLMHKTQVFLSPEGDHYRTRLTHTLEVVQIARTIARALGLNEDLTEAIGLGHDLGHTPFGHAGERVLNELHSDGFLHNEHSVRVVEKLEKNGSGLNLTYQVKDGIRCHTGDKPADTIEGRIVHFADRIAYINHDIDDAITAEVLDPRDIPGDLTQTLGKTGSERINCMVCSIIQESYNKTIIKMEDNIQNAADNLRRFMFDTVYINPVAKGEESKARNVLESLYLYFIKNNGDLPSEFVSVIEDEGIDRAVCDYIAGMTDRYAIYVYNNIFVPKSWSKIN